MVRIDHSRPILKIIDAFQRQRMNARTGTTYPTKVSQFNESLKLTATQEKQIVHAHAVQVLKHVSKHGDVRVAHHFISAIGHGQTETAVTKWFCRFGPMDANASGVLEFVRNQGCQMAEAQMSPYWTFFPKRELRVVDPIQEVEHLVRKLRGQVGQANCHELLVPVLNDLQALLGRHRSG